MHISPATGAATHTCIDTFMQSSTLLMICSVENLLLNRRHMHRMLCMQCTLHLHKGVLASSACMHE